MSNSPMTSLNSFINKAAMSLNAKSNLISLDNLQSYQQQKSLEDKDNYKNKANDENTTFDAKVFDALPLVNNQQHALHHLLKSFGYLPDALLESIVGYLKGPTAEQYSHADAHLRLIIAVNSKLKTPLELDKMQELRARFATDAIALQDPKVWRQASTTVLSHLKLTSKKHEPKVSWQDKIIANADDEDMTIRCYQADAHSKHSSNTDKTTMLFFHGGGFCIGDLNTHHEFCHTVCSQTGWSVVSVDYRLAPEHAAPTALRDAIAAYAWLTEHSHTLGALSSRIVLAGDSAGGGLSTLLAQQIATPNEQAWSDLGSDGQDMFKLLKTLPKPIAQIPLYPVTDIENDYPSWELYGEGLLLDHADVAVFDEAFMQHSTLSRDHALIAPMLGDNRQVCPTYVVASELDVLRDEAFAYADLLKSYDIAVETHTVMGAPHGFIHLISVHKGLEQETQFIINDFARFVREVIDAQALLVA